MLELRDYQRRSLDALESYLRATVQHGARTAFLLQPDMDRPYRPVPQLPGLPYICLRIPTGGGKTLMACHALGIATTEFLQAERAVCLWLVPSNTIRGQTLAALRDRQHPYRQAVDAHFGGLVTIMDLTEALYVTRGTLAGDTCIIVSTLAALRVEDTEGRKVYETCGALMDHFSGLSAELEAQLEKNGDGVTPYSLCNVLRLHRPIVIMDEAHNARTKLSFDTLARFNPSCIVEFTATPETTHKPERGHFASNILCHVSAAELKAEDMVKLPIKLETRSEWKEVVAEALKTQRTLEALAVEEERQTGEYIRPIVLLQAQPKSQTKETLTVEVVRQSLIDDFKIPEDQIAVATGQTREIDDVDLFARDCPIRFIITVAALKEGWDCSFAYVLCSVAEIGSARAVEQVLGRVLRLPRATRKKHPELNCAYALAASRRFIEAATSLKDALIENGFQRMEAELYVEGQEQRRLFEAELPLFETPGPSQPRLTELGPFRVPMLAIRVDGQLELFEEGHFLDTPWRLSECDAGLSEAEFPSEYVGGATAEIDVTDEGKLEVHFVDQIHRQLRLLGMEPGWDVAGLTNWLDRQIPHVDITRTESTLFIHRVLTGLVESRGLSVQQLASQKFRLRAAVANKIDQHRKAQAARAFQRILFSEGAAEVEVGPEICLDFAEDRYSPNSYYEGIYHFPKHYFPVIGEMNAEECDCADFLDRLEAVKYWVRNLVRSDSSFWLQTSTDKFYPDFVVLLHDGRILVVEYKNERDWDLPDSEEKRAVGQLWADRSKGRCLFVMPKGPDWGAIARAVAR